MFNDERINAESGKIYQRGILYATLVTLIYGTLRGIYLAAYEHFRIAYLYTELAIVLCGAVILTVGAIRFPRDGDERTVADKHRYFLGAGKTFIVVALAGYAVTIPFATGKNFGDMPINQIILILETLGYIYFFHTFKTRGICFNYTVIAEEKPVYYRAVFANIGKLAGLLFVAFAFAAILDLGVNGSFLNFLGILMSYAESVIGLGIEYLFLSWLEKRAYDEEDSERLKSSTVISLLFLIGFTLISAIFDMIYIVIATGHIAAIEGSVGATLNYVAQARIPAGYAVAALTAVCVCFLLTQIGTAPRTRRAAKWFLGFSAFSILYSTFTSLLYSILVPLFEHMTDPLAIRSLLEINNGAAYLVSLIGIGLRLWLIHSLMTEVGVAKIIILAPILRIATFLADLFFKSQSMMRTSAVLGAVVSLASVIIVFAVLNAHKFSPTFPEDEVE